MKTQESKNEENNIMTKKHHTDGTDDMAGSPEDHDDVVIEEEGETGQDKIKKLREKLKVCLAERQEYLEGWQRMRADFANARKNEEEKISQVRQVANEALIEDLLPVLDSFDMAFSNKEAWEKVDKNWRDGITYIHAQLIGALGNYGLTTIDPKDEMFDHVVHASLEAVPTDKADDDHKIAEVLQKGYKLREKVIRPAKVKTFVAKQNGGNEG